MTETPPGRPSEPPTPPGSPAPAHGDGPTGPSAPTGHTGLRDQIAEALGQSITQWWQTPPRLDLAADAVLHAIEGQLQQTLAERDTARAGLDGALTGARFLREDLADLRAELAKAKRQREQALDQIADERRARLAAEAAARRGREIHRPHDCARHVSARTPVPCANEGLCEWCGAPHPCRTYAALAIKQPKETPMPIDPGAYLRGIYKLDEPAPSKPTVKGTPDATPLDITKEVQETLEALLPHLQGEHMRDLWHANDLMSELIERLEDER